MKAAVRQVNGVSVIDLTGKITIGKGDVVLREQVNQLLGAGERQILINLAGVSYMDSCGLGELAACHRHAAEQQATLKLLNPSGKVFALLEMIKLEELIDTFGDEAEALESFSPQPRRNAV